MSQSAKFAPFLPQNIVVKSLLVPNLSATLKNKKTAVLGGFCKLIFALKQVNRHFATNVDTTIVKRASVIVFLVF